MILYMYIAPGQQLTTPWGRNLCQQWSKYDCKRGLEMGVSGLRSTTFVIMYQTVRLGL